MPLCGVRAIHYRILRYVRFHRELENHLRCFEAIRIKDHFGLARNLAGASDMADEDPTTLVRITRKRSNWISAGAHLGGLRSALLMQNHGFLAAINPIVSLSFLYKIPLLMMISYRGHMGERDPWQTQGGRLTEPVLKALDIPYEHLTNAAEVPRQIAQAQTLAESSLTPVTLLLSRQLMWKD